MGRVTSTRPLPVDRGPVLWTSRAVVGPGRFRVPTVVTGTSLALMGGEPGSFPVLMGVTPEQCLVPMGVDPGSFRAPVVLEPGWFRALTGVSPVVPLTVRWPVVASVGTTRPPEDGPGRAGVGLRSTRIR